MKHVNISLKKIARHFRHHLSTQRFQDLLVVCLSLSGTICKKQSSDN